jgi:hypothetical protein
MGCAASARPRRTRRRDMRRRRHRRESLVSPRSVHAVTARHVQAGDGREFYCADVPRGVRLFSIRVSLQAAKSKHALLFSASDCLAYSPAHRSWSRFNSIQVHGVSFFLTAFA